MFQALQQFFWEYYGHQEIAKNMAQICMETHIKYGMDLLKDQLKVDGGFCRQDIAKICQLIEDHSN